MLCPKGCKIKPKTVLGGVSLCHCLAEGDPSTDIDDGTHHFIPKENSEFVLTFVLADWLLSDPTRMLLAPSTLNVDAKDRRWNQNVVQSVS